MQNTTLIQFKAHRAPLGLALTLSVDGQLDCQWHIAGESFSDETFICSKSRVSALLNFIETHRQDIMARLKNAGHVSLLIPQANPPIIRVTSKNVRGAYFNLGELIRWRFLKDSLKFPFKEHQSIGVLWLGERPVGILADDMGLGKTLQTIAALEIALRQGSIQNALILCPKSLIGNWEAEIQIWAERLCTVALHSSIPQKEWKKVSAQSHVTITNYEAIRSSAPTSELFDLIVYDEIHRLKNPKSLNYKSASKLRPKIAWGLSGTPMENEARDLIAVLHLLDPKRISLSDYNLSAASLRSLASRYLLRRPRSVLASELPEVVEKTEMIPLSQEQKKNYQNILMTRATGNLGDWVSTFNLLRDACDFDPVSKRSSKIDRAFTLISAIRSLQEKTVVFSYKLEPLRLLEQQLKQKYGSQFAATITGETSSTRRSDIVSAFQSDETPFVLLCSLRATAEGLTLTAANHVIFLNEWWNPALNFQARDRVNRIGQTKDVFVYRLRTQGTIESRLDEILHEKSALFDEIINKISMSNISSADPVPTKLAQLIIPTTDNSQ